MTTLAQGVNIGDKVWTASDDDVIAGSPFPVRLVVGTEAIRVTGAEFDASGKRTRWSVERHVDGTVEAAHTAGATIQAGPITGSYLTAD